MGVFCFVLTFSSLFKHQHSLHVFQMAKAMVTSGFPTGSHPYSVLKIDAQKENAKSQMHNFAI